MNLDTFSPHLDPLQVKQRAFEFCQDLRRMWGLSGIELRNAFSAQLQPLIDGHRRNPLEAEDDYHRHVGNGDARLYFAYLEFLAAHFDEVDQACAAYDELRRSGAQVALAPIVASLGEIGS